MLKTPILEMMEVHIFFISAFFIKNWNATKTNLITFDWKWSFCRILTVLFSKATIYSSIILCFMGGYVFPYFDASVSLSELKCNISAASTGFPCWVFFCCSLSYSLSLVLMQLSNLCSTFSVPSLWVLSMFYLISSS